MASAEKSRDRTEHLIADGYADASRAVSQGDPVSPLETSLCVTRRTNPQLDGPVICRSNGGRADGKLMP
ncbi:hypothetical protein SKAU_G00055530 [Synaphobranchus kaupii]|uniref:Uncharacterized protein n=1 Tax=Synaphobranchus kaupii TaxID=118154 RepID=A0A9Q1J9V0_SYNKA|nr:hypothetical protein SKAU_G00055530 [Synaphobranchus kaupii]